jgi:hypothetical protein
VTIGAQFEISSLSFRFRGGAPASVTRKEGFPFHDPTRLLNGTESVPYREKGN